MSTKFKSSTNDELRELLKKHETDKLKDIQEVWDEVEKRNFLPKFFGFHDQNTEIKYLLPVTCTAAEWEDWSEDTGLEFVGSLEMIFGVHDVNDQISSESQVFGYTSYEIEGEGRIEDLLLSWKDKLVELGWANREDTWITVTE